MLIFFFVLGIIFGSFANVLIYRLPLNISIISPFSYCPKCKTTIKWYYNIPIISFIILKGRCKFCREKISFIYPFVELFCGIISIILYLNFNNFVLTIIFFNLCFILFVMFR
jgi:leader peptidase (prepilin peptidase)/N-methyltransferase